MKGRRLGDFCLFAGRLAAKVQSYAAITSVIPLLMKFPSPPLPSPPLPSPLLLSLSQAADKHVTAEQQVGIR